jgi:hypothetical protein
VLVSLPSRTVALLLSGGALGVALTTAMEVVTAPYSPAVSAYWLNPTVHVLKVVAVLVVAAGLIGLAATSGAGGQRRLGRVGSAAAVVLALATVAGAGPYSVVEARLDGGLTPAAADRELEVVYDAEPWISALAMVALPLVLLGLVALAVAVLRSRALPRWAPVVSLLSLPVAVLAGVLGEAGLPVPHPPAWLFLGLAAYGLALLRSPSPSSPAETEEDRLVRS